MKIAENKLVEVEARCDAFFGSMSAAQRGRHEKALAKMYNFDDRGCMSVKAFINLLFEQGNLAVGTYETDRVKEPTARQWFRMDRRQQEEAEQRIAKAGKKTVYCVETKDEATALTNQYELGKEAYNYAQFLLKLKHVVLNIANQCGRKDIAFASQADWLQKNCPGMTSLPKWKLPAGFRV